MTIGEVALTVVLTGLGLFLWRLAMQSVQLRRAMKRWPVVSGVVRGRRVRPGTRNNRFVDVQVSYHYNGSDYLTWCVSPTRAGYGGDANLARSREFQMADGAQVAVLVNRERPDTAFLRLPEPHVIVMMTLGGAVLLGVAAASALTTLGIVTEQVVTVWFMAGLAVGLAAFTIAAGVELLRR